MHRIKFINFECEIDEQYKSLVYNHANKLCGINAHKTNWVVDIKTGYGKEYFTESYQSNGGTVVTQGSSVRPFFTTIVTADVECI